MRTFSFSKVVSLFFLAALASALTAGQAYSEMTVVLRSGRTMSLPIDSCDVSNIQFVREQEEKLRVFLKNGGSMSLPVGISDISKITYSLGRTTGDKDKRGPFRNDDGDCSWSGQWSSNWGSMEFVQRGRTVNGGYTHDQGRINGKLYNNKLVGTWSEAPTYSLPNDSGSVEFTMSDNCRSFTGRWRYGFEGGWSEDWKASR